VTENHNMSIWQVLAGLYTRGIGLI